MGNICIHLLRSMFVLDGGYLEINEHLIQVIIILAT